MVEGRDFVVVGSCWKEACREAIAHLLKERVLVLSYYNLVLAGSCALTCWAKRRASLPCRRRDERNHFRGLITLFPWPHLALPYLQRKPYRARSHREMQRKRSQTGRPPRSFLHASKRNCCWSNQNGLFFPTLTCAMLTFTTLKGTQSSSQIECHRRRRRRPDKL